ncbi:proton-coupled amino acid transporter 2-like isoform X1 [Harmonia axyridis]|uniref:proton-coupled amino acid transporter 2-like isoform X1 n=1 Tax=Harmonia axyridis TaxID=115357 RepID=UPI001E2798DA|nr:proton-coupled amino acid transporter 2-like isoform X1 [Harmonia axyridis]
MSRTPISVSSSLPSRSISPTKIFSYVKGRQGPIRDRPGTSYCATLMHHVKGNIGTGIFAMGDAMKNGGLVMGPAGLTFLGFLNLYCQHQLVQAADQVAFNHDYNVKPDYAETVMVGFMDGPERTRNLCFFMKRLVNTFLIITEMGFCCVYLVFIGESLEKILAIYGIHDFSTRLLILFTVLPIWLLTLMNNLRVLVPASLVANIFTFAGLLITLYYNFVDIPDPWRLPLIADWHKIPLFFGTAIFSFEAIGLVLPMYNEMKNPKHFNTWYGVMNIGMTYVIVMNTVVGASSYIRWGEDIKASVTLNLPAEVEILAQLVVILIAISVAFTYILQMYVAFMIMFPWIYRKFGPFRFQYWVEVLFKTFLSAIAYILAETIPYLGEFISLVGAIGGTSLALVFPPLLELVTFYETIGCFGIFKNIVILAIGFTGIVTGTYAACNEIFLKFMESLH